jgi:hypothetical protein
MSKKLPHTLENVCLSTDEECQMYAVGSKAHTDLLDSRTLQVRMTPKTFAKTSQYGGEPRLSARG